MYIQRATLLSATWSKGTAFRHESETPQRPQMVIRSVLLHVVTSLVYPVHEAAARVAVLQALALAGSGFGDIGTLY